MPSRHTYYEVEDDSVEIVKEKCPRCGDAYLADHGDRKHCGKCGYAEFS